MEIIVYKQHHSSPSLRRNSLCHPKLEHPVVGRFGKVKRNWHIKSYLFTQLKCVDRHLYWTCLLSLGQCPILVALLCITVNLSKSEQGGGTFVRSALVSCGSEEGWLRMFDVLKDGSRPEGDGWVYLRAEGWFQAWVGWFGLKKGDYEPARADLRPARLNLWSESADFRHKRPNLRLNSRLERADLKPESKVWGLMGLI